MQRILHIGATAGERVLVRRMLEDHAYQVEDVEDVEGALAIARLRRPDLLLLEGRAAESDGLELATRIKASPELSPIPLILVVDPGERELALSLGADGVLERPLDPRPFARRIRSFLKGKRDRVSPATQSRHLQAYSQSLVDRLRHSVQELELANARLRRVDDLKNELIENVSRELATPLTPLIGLVDLLDSGRLGPLTPRQRRAVRTLSHALHRLGETVDHLLDLASFEDEGPLAPRPTDVVALAREALAAVREKARSRRIRIETHLPRQLEVTLDRERVLLALVHLLDSAIRAAPRGGHVLLEVDASRAEELRISVYDSGAAIDAEARPYVFEPFFVARPLAGGGLSPGSALALVQRVACAHGGRVEVESPPRSHPSVDHDYPGAKFSLVLPGAGADSPPPGTLASSRRGGR